MRRPGSALFLSVVATLAVLAAMTSLAWMIDGGGNKGGSADVGLSILTSTYPEDVIPRAMIVMLLVGGGVLLFHPNNRRRLPAIATVCALVGVGACLHQIVLAELAFGRMFSNEPPSGGWSLGAARAYFLPAPYLAALTQAGFGMIACTLLLGIGAFRRRV